MAYGFPFQTIPHEVTFRKSTASRSGGVSLSGIQRVVRSDAGFWLASMNVMIRGEHRTLAYRALYAALDGMAGEILVPIYTRFRPVDANGRRIAWAGAVTMGGNVLADNTGLGQTEEVLMTVGAPALAGATRIYVTHPGVTGLRPGHYFGIGERLYLIARAWQTSIEYAEAAGGEYTFGGEPYTFGGEPYTFGATETVRVGTNVQTLDFWPRLREPVFAGDPLILGRPICKMRLASDDTGALTEARDLASAVSLEFMEVV